MKPVPRRYRSRSICSKVFYKKFHSLFDKVLKYYEVSLVKLQASSLQIYWQRPPRRCFLLNFSKLLRTLFIEHLQVTSLRGKIMLPKLCNVILTIWDCIFCSICHDCSTKKLFWKIFSSLKITAGHQHYRTNQVSIMVVFQDDSVKFLEVLIFRTLRSTSSVYSFSFYSICFCNNRKKYAIFNVFLL